MEKFQVDVTILEPIDFSPLLSVCLLLSNQIIQFITCGLVLYYGIFIIELNKLFQLLLAKRLFGSNIDFGFDAPTSSSPKCSYYFRQKIKILGTRQTLFDDVRQIW